MSCSFKNWKKVFLGLKEQHEKEVVKLNKALELYQYNAGIKEQKDAEQHLLLTRQKEKVEELVQKREEKYNVLYEESQNIKDALVQKDAALIELDAEIQSAHYHLSTNTYRCYT